MVDESTHVNEPTLGEASIDACNEEDNGTTRYCFSQNEHICTNDVLKDMASGLLNTSRLCYAGNSSDELISMMELSKAESGRND